MPSRIRTGTQKRYYDALCDLRDNPGVYNSHEWCTKHGIGHSAPRAMKRIGHVQSINSKLHLMRERITDNMINEILIKKREFDNLRHDKHKKEEKPHVTPLNQEAHASQIHVEIKEQQTSAPNKVGIIRRFINWIY